ncbi:MAG: DUF4382 domain-containing protein [Candidatus Thermoplasmatota archaeon]
MNTRFAVLSGLLMTAAALAGCASGETGTLGVHVTDAPGAIGDFSSLTIVVSEIVLKVKDKEGMEKEAAFAPAAASFDLVKLLNGNLTTLFRDDVPAGNYSKMELVISSASGVLKADGSAVTVKAPKGSIFLPTKFTVEAGKEVDFLFDIHVVSKGSGDYSLQPNAGGSKTIAKPTDGKVPA